MSPRIIQLPMSGRDRRHYVRELKAAEQAHQRLTAEVDAAYRIAADHLRQAHALACREWSTRQFIDVADELRRRCDLQLRDVPSSIEEFVERHEGHGGRQLTLRLV